MSGPKARYNLQPSRDPLTKTTLRHKIIKIQRKIRIWQVSHSWQLLFSRRRPRTDHCDSNNLKLSGVRKFLNCFTHACLVCMFLFYFVGLFIIKTRFTIDLLPLGCPINPYNIMPRTWPLTFAIHCMEQERNTAEHVAVNLIKLTVLHILLNNSLL